MLAVTPAGWRELVGRVRHTVLRPFGLYRVSGGSMLPGLRPGDVLLGRRWGTPKVGQMVVVDFGRPYVKRLIRIEPDGRLWIEGDNRDHSDDSRAFGAVPPDALVAIIIAKIASAG